MMRSNFLIVRDISSTSEESIVFSVEDAPISIEIRSSEAFHTIPRTLFPSFFSTSSSVSPDTTTAFKLKEPLDKILDSVPFVLNLFSASSDLLPAIFATSEGDPPVATSST